MLSFFLAKKSEFEPMYRNQNKPAKLSAPSAKELPTAASGTLEMDVIMPPHTLV